MTKKDYETIANALKPFFNSHEYMSLKMGDTYPTVDIINAITKQIKLDNPTFDSVKFLDYLRSN